MSSIWNDTAIRHFPSLKENTKAHTVIIGGGMAGILIANALRERGLEPLLIEAKTIGSGQTKNTTAKITAQHADIYSKITRYYGGAAAQQYATANGNAIADFERIIREKSIECDFEKTDAVLYSLHHPEKINEEYLAAKAAGIDCFKTERVSLPFSVAGALVFKNQAQFHPLKFISALTDGLTIYENTPAIKVEGNTVFTPKAKITAEHIVFTCHFPFVNFPSFYFLRMNQERSYVTALEDTERSLNGMYIGMEDDSLSLRRYGNLLLLGGGAHRTGRDDKGRAYAMLKDTARKLFPNAKIIAQWSAQDCITLDGIPYIGSFRKENEHIYVATGFNKWGMTSSMVSASILSDMICGVRHPDSEIFSPQRFNLMASAKNLCVNTGETIKGFASHLKPSFTSPASVSAGTAKEIEWNGKTAGAYRDTDGKLYIVTLKCPHLKCKLQWNATTKTWDCPCHGSRYDYKGNLLDNPAQTGSILLTVQ